MTLNIALITSDAIHLAADFRLSQLRRGTTGRWVPLGKDSAKIVTVQYWSWTGLISYCGIGMWNGKFTYRYLAEWLGHSFGEQKTFEDIVSVVQAKGSDWLREISAASGRPQHHTFIVAGFVNNRSKLALVSSYESLGVPFSPRPASDLVVSRSSAKHTPLCITGIPKAVTDRDRVFLEYLGKKRTDASVVRYQLAAVNARAASSKESQNGISPSCLAYSLTADGSGEGQCYGDVEGEMLPIHITHGLNLMDMIKINPAPGRQVQFRGSTMATSESNEAVIAEQITCVPEVSTAKPSHPTANDLVLREFGSVNEYYCDPVALNDHRVVVGECRIPVSSLPHACRWTEEEGIQDLGTLGGPQSRAHDVNSNGAIVGSAQSLPHSNRAFLWTAERGMVDLGTLGGSDSTARAINDRGQVVGSSNITPGEPTQNDQRAFLWTPVRGMTNLGALGDSWSVAEDINDSGQVVGMSVVGGSMHAFLWTESDGMRDLGTLGGDFAYAYAINEAGVILVESEIAPDQRRICLWTEDKSLVDIGLGAGYQARGINDIGEIIGTYNDGARVRPFLWSEADGFVRIPWFRDHDTEVRKINNVGNIVGYSKRGTWKHLHAVLWSNTSTGD